MPTSEQIEKAARAVYETIGYDYEGRLILGNGDPYGEWDLAIKAARAALTAAEEVKPSVKPLEWLKHPKANLWRAECIIGIYQVHAVIPHSEWQFDAFDGIKTTGESENPSEAKAAAQDDYEARIISALTTRP